MLHDTKGSAFVHRHNLADCFSTKDANRCVPVSERNSHHVLQEYAAVHWPCGYVWRTIKIRMPKRAHGRKIRLTQYVNPMGNTARAADPLLKGRARCTSN